MIKRFCDNVTCEVIELARPVKWRKIENMPQILRFAPAPNPAANRADGPELPVGENILKLEELEAIRLKDLEGLEQEDCAARMEISRPTFQRILVTARQKIADSLIHGKSISFEGGNFTQNICQFRCQSCGREWVEPLEAIEAGKLRHNFCPKCRSAEIKCCPDDDSEAAADCRKKCFSRHIGH